MLKSCRQPSENAKTLKITKYVLFSYLIFFVNLNWYLIFTYTVQNDLILVLCPFSLCIITFLMYFFIHLYLIYMCLYTELFSKLPDAPDSHIFSPYGVLTSVASWLMCYIFSHLFSLHQHSTTRDSAALSFPSIPPFPFPSLLYLLTLLFTIWLFSIHHALLWQSFLPTKSLKDKETF